MLRLTTKGDWRKTERWLKKLDAEEYAKVLTECGELGVRALREATPVRTGKTANSWTYEVRQESKGVSIVWRNTNLTSQGDPVAILLQYGHGTGTGGYVKGQDYINPAMKPVFDTISEKVRKAVISD